MLSKARYKRQQAGFTLIELMIVVVVITILASIALPSYSNYVQKARRSDAKVALSKVAAMQERFFLRNNAYTSNVNELGGSGGSMSSPEGWYTITSSVSGCASGNDGSCFTLTATATGAQLEDTDCRRFTLNDVGRKQAYDDNSDASDNCW